MCLNANTKTSIFESQSSFSTNEVLVDNSITKVENNIYIIKVG
jgi:hypothetical protein